ncbi:MAG: hypothetical protein JWR63_2100 [Conexibacter sp.]|nr:hypothetical protein [Conexibacter sp.]
MRSSSDPPPRHRFRAAASPVTCTACGADAFAIGGSTEDDATLRLDLDLRCGACGLWQRRTLDAAVAERFLDHLAATQQAIARELVALARATTDL